MRNQLNKNLIDLDGFEARGENAGRLESLSDGVFALAIALLLFSSNALTTFDELKGFIIDLVPFAICLVFIMWMWRAHVIYYLKYGIRDFKSVSLNAAFLFAVLMFVYPLKFLFSFIFNSILVLVSYLNGAENVSREGFLRSEDTFFVMIIYGIGFMTVFIILALMYRHALKQKDNLGLSAYEVQYTEFSIWKNLAIAFGSIVSILIALIAYLLESPTLYSVSGMSYALVGLWVYLAQRIKGVELESSLVENESS